MQTIMQYSITYPTHPQDILALNKIVSRNSFLEKSSSRRHLWQQ
jgi:hypothetical protein